MNDNTTTTKDKLLIALLAICSLIVISVNVAVNFL